MKYGTVEKKTDSSKRTTSIVIKKKNLKLNTLSQIKKGKISWN